MGTYTDEKHESLSKGLREVRRDLGLTLRDASKYFKMSASEYSKLENGISNCIDDFIYGKEEIEVMCHRCGNNFKTIPILNIAFPAYVCKECAEKGDTDEHN